VNTSAAWLLAELHARTTRHRHRRLHGDRGEGVISAAIAVLIMAFLGAAMWLGFSNMWKTTETKIECQVNAIGAAAPANCP
jgi:hypothetical protein